MARLPSKFDLSGPVSLRSGRAIASWDTSGLGRGAAAAGNALEGVGDDFMRQEARARREGIALEGTAADGGAMKELSDFERGFDADADYGTFGPRFEKGATAIRDKWARTINDPKARQAWSLEFDKRVLSGRSRVLDLGNRRIREGKLVNAKTGLEGYQSILADPDVAADVRTKAKTDADASIGALQSQGLLTPSEADDWRDKIIKGGEFVLGQREIERNPEIITGKLPSNVSERAGLAMGYFQKHGYTKEQAAGIVGNLLAESGLNTGARNAGDGRDGSDSIGIGQWNSTRARALMKFAGERGKDWRDFETQLAFVVHELDGSHKSIGDRLRAAKDLKEATHAGIMFEGPAGSQNGPENAMHYDKRMKFAAQAAGETIKPDWYTSQSPDNQLRLERQADARRNEIRVESRGALDTVVQNAPVAVQNTGTYDGQLPTLDNFVAAYGEREGSERFSAFQTAMDVGNTAYQMRGMSADEINRVVSDAEPSSSGDSAALETKRYEAISAAAATTLKSRTADPGGYAMEVFPAVQRAWAGALEPNGYQAAIAASVAAQQQLGIQNIQPLPKKVADDVVSTFKDQNRPEVDRMSVVTDALMSTGDSGQRKAVFEQLVEAGLPEATEGAFLALERGDDGAARRLFQAAVVNPSDLPGKIEATPADIDQGIQDAIMADGQVGAIYYGLADGTSDNYVRAQRDSKLLVNAVNLRMRAGETLDDAISGASKDLFGDVQVVNDGNAQLLLPVEQDADAVLRGLTATMPAVRTVLEQSFTGPKLEGRTGSIVAAASAARTEDILANGYFRNAEDGYVFIDPYTGGAVSDANGQPVIFQAPITIGNAPSTGSERAARRQRVSQPNDKPLTDDDFDRFQQRMLAQ